MVDCWWLIERQKEKRSLYQSCVPSGSICGLRSSTMIVALIAPTAEPNWLIMLPFAILLLSIAFAPLILQPIGDRHYHRLCFFLGGVFWVYYVLKKGRRERDRE